VIDVRAESWKHEFTEKEKIYQTDPDFCCTINKIEPFDEIKKNYDVWVSSLMRWQTEHRATLDIFVERGGIIRFYPLIDMTKQERDDYIAEHNLPFHPLVANRIGMVAGWIAPRPSAACTSSCPGIPRFCAESAEEFRAGSSHYPDISGIIRRGVPAAMPPTPAPHRRG